MSITRVTNNVIETLNASKLTGALPDALKSITKNASDPAVDTNPAGGLGTVWVNSTSGEIFVLTDATAGANVWTNTGEGSGNVAPVSYMTIANTSGTVTTDGDYKVVTFNGSGTFTPAIGTAGIGDFVEYLVVAGGGGGGGTYYGGGGGAGGYQTATNFTITNGEKTVLVGGGGQVNVNGSNSVFESITSTGGGAGGTGEYSGLNAAANGKNGGSGGGGNANNNTGGTGISGQGFAGGNASGSAGGSGGGAGAAAANNPSNNISGIGGVGLSSNITGTNVVRGEGGTGGGYNGSANPVAGGGKGGRHANAGGGGAIAATVNLGGGGGGAGFVTAGNGSGGSGVVILRFKFQ
jgi:hypothetical protein